MTKCRFGTDITGARTRGYSHLLYTEFPDFDAMTAYRDHPVHQAFLAWLNERDCARLPSTTSLTNRPSSCPNSSPTRLKGTSPWPRSVLARASRAPTRSRAARCGSPTPSRSPYPCLPPAWRCCSTSAASPPPAAGPRRLAFLLGGIACLALAFVVIGFTRRMASAGYAYTYASRSLGKGAGFMAGWLYFFGMICFVPMTMSGVGYLAADLLASAPSWWIVFFFIGMALFLVLSAIRIRVTTRVQLYVGIVTIVIILIVDAGHDREGRSHGQAPSAFTFGHSLSGGFSGVFYGIILGVTSYIGFETAADFGEETSNPRRYIPIAVIAATGFVVIFYLWTTYSITIGFGVNNGAKFGADPVALKTTATTFVGPWLGTLVEIGGMLRRSSFAWPARRPLRGRCSRWAARACCRRRSATLTPVQDAGERDARRDRGRHRDGAAGRVPVLRQRVRRAVQQLLLLGHDRHAGDHRRLHVAVRRRHRVLLPHPRLAAVESARPRPGAGDRRGRVRRGPVRFGAPDPDGHTRLDTVAGRWPGWSVGVAILLWLRARRPEAVAQIGSILGEEGGADAAVLDASG